MSKIDWYLRRAAHGYILDTGTAQYPCLIGRSGLIDAHLKTEGDGATPKGRWPVRGLYYRQDKLPEQIRGLAAQLTTQPIYKNLGWCDDPHSASYNCPVRLPFSGRHETMWRLDGLYDLVLPLGYNDGPAIAPKGSAIFLHCAQEDTAHTQGCLALKKTDLLALLPQIHPQLHINI